MNPDDVRSRISRRLRTRPPFLYGLLDHGLLELTAIPPVAADLAHRGVGLLQLRAKSLATGAFVQLAQATLEALAGSGVALLINDRVDVALAAGADGAHVGASDLEPAAARQLLGEERILGVTAHDRAELGAVDPQIVDYVGYGAVFGTQTRANARICGPEALTMAVAASTVPMVAIGGIRPENVQALRGSGVAAVAAASALLPGRTSPGAVEEFLKVLQRW